MTLLYRNLKLTLAVEESHLQAALERERDRDRNALADEHRALRKLERDAQIVRRRNVPHAHPNVRNARLARALSDPERAEAEVASTTRNEAELEDVSDLPGAGHPPVHDRDRLADARTDADQVELPP